MAFNRASANQQGQTGSCHFDMIESADSVHLMQAVDKEAAKAGKVQEILLQVNIAREEQKQGSARKIMRRLCPNLTILKTCTCAG